MLSASSRLKQVAGPRWKTPKLFCISSFLYSPRSYSSFDCVGSDFSLKKLYGSISHFLNTKHITVKLPWGICSLLSTCNCYKSRSLVTKASIEDDQVAYQVLNEIMSELKKSPSSVKEVCTNHINELCKKRKLQAAARLLRLLRYKHAIINNCLPAYNLLLAAACEKNDTQIASHVFKDMLIDHVSMNSTTYFHVAKAISRSNDLTLVQSFVKEISELMITMMISSASATVIINRIMYAFADCGHVHNAMLVFDHIKFKPDLVTYNTVLGILGKAGRVDEMLNVFATMKRTDNDIEPDIFSYNTLLHRLRKVGRFDLCVVLIKEMGKVGLQPDLITYTALIECFFKSGNIEESLRLFQDMKKRVRPSVYIYRSLINNLKKLGKSELALKFWEEMNQCRVDDLVGPKDFKQENR